MLVREPDQLGVERAHPQLAFGLRLVELSRPNRHVAANDDRAPATLERGRSFFPSVSILIRVSRAAEPEYRSTPKETS